MFNKFVSVALDKKAVSLAKALDILKGFDRVCYAGVLRNLNHYGVCNRILDLIQLFLTNRVMEVILNGHTSRSFHINAGPPEGYLLGLLLFVNFINVF